MEGHGNSWQKCVSGVQRRKVSYGLLLLDSAVCPPTLRGQPLRKRRNWGNDSHDCARQASQVLCALADKYSQFWLRCVREKARKGQNFHRSVFQCKTGSPSAQSRLSRRVSLKG